MPGTEEYEHELESLHSAKMEEEETENENDNDNDVAELVLHDSDLEEEDPLAAAKPDTTAQYTYGSALDRSTKRKLDGLLLPFLGLLFLLNSVDKSNIGNAETAGFTRDAGLAPRDLNASMGYFFAFFVALQPVGAALGRKFGMVRWVPACMTLWGCCTLLHMWVRSRWQLILLRIAIAVLEAGFYPTTVAYLSLFYTRYEFAVRLSLFYGQTAVAGVIGGVLSWAVFSRFEKAPPDQPGSLAGMKGWQVLFLVEGCLTIFVALLGFIWLPRSADTAWFFNDQEKRWAEQRIRLDYQNAHFPESPHSSRAASSSTRDQRSSDAHSSSHDQEDEEELEAHHRLLRRSTSEQPLTRTISITAHAGLSKQDIIHAILSYRIWHLLICNIFSAIPATAFSVFLPLVMKQLSPSLDLRPSESNLLSAPPFAFGAIMLFVFASWSDRRRQRIVPVIWGLTLLIVGLTVTVLVPMSSYVLRYMALCILLSGTFIASPLTVAWITNNSPEPGKRAVLLGINGWGNLGGVFLTVLFTPEDRKNGYIRPFVITLLCALASAVGYIVFWIMLLRENRQREVILSQWSEEDKEREEHFGDMPIPATPFTRLQQALGLDALAKKLGLSDGRTGDEKMTFKLGM